MREMLLEIIRDPEFPDLERHPDVGYAFLKTLFYVLSERLGKANQRVEHLFAWGLKVHGIDKHL